MSSKPTPEAHQEVHENVKTCPSPMIESNIESRHHIPVKKVQHDLQEEQFLSHTNGDNNKVVYGNPIPGGKETVREATMSLYNSLNASDHI